MSVICRKEQGAFLSHLPLKQPTLCVDVEKKDEGSKDAQDTGGGVQGYYHWKRELYAVNCPFMMDSQVDRIRREATAKSDHDANIKESSAQRKRRKKSQKGIMPSESERKITDLISRVLPSIVQEARDKRHLGEFQSSSTVLYSNDTARAASQIAGCGDMFQRLCCDFDDENGEDQLQASDIIVLNGDITSYRAQFIIGKSVHNTESCSRIIDVESHTFVVPQHSSFLTSSFHHFVSGGFRKIQVDTGYDLIVIDPPWNNKSVKRKKSYYMVQEADLKQIPITSLAGKECLVCVWITNNNRLKRYVIDELFPHWSVEFIAEWLWIKVTNRGELVCDILSSHKKPYEQLIIGRLKRPSLENTEAGLHSFNSNVPIISVNKDEETNTTRSSYCGSLAARNIGQERIRIPKDFMLVSVPCSLHSKKPTLADIMSNYLPTSPCCLELFARNLTPCWVSWGNEPLLHQHMDLFEQPL